MKNKQLNLKILYLFFIILSIISAFKKEYDIANNMLMWAVMLRFNIDEL